MDASFSMNTDVKGVTTSSDFFKKRIEYLEENSFFEEDAEGDTRDTLLVTMLASLDHNIECLAPKTRFGLIVFNSEVDVIGDGD